MTGGPLVSYKAPWFFCSSQLFSSSQGSSMGLQQVIKHSFGISKMKVGKKPVMGVLTFRLSEAWSVESWSKTRGKEVVGTGRSVLGPSP